MSLESGDHVWYWDGNVSQELDIPRAAWFPGSSGPTDYLGHGGDIFNFVIYDDQVLRGQPHMRGHPGSFAWMNNNPGNLTGVSGGMNLGQFPDKFNWHHLLIFPTQQDGFDAIALFLRTPAYVDLSLVKAFKKYGLGGEGNDAVAYANDVADEAGVVAETTIGDLTDEQLALVQKKISDIEGVVAGDTLDRDSSDLPEEILSQLA